jgi:hypothetical protein
LCYQRDAGFPYAGLAIYGGVFPDAANRPEQSAYLFRPTFQQIIGVDGCARSEVGVEFCLASEEDLVRVAKVWHALRFLLLGGW